MSRRRGGVKVSGSLATNPSRGSHAFPIGNNTMSPIGWYGVYQTTSIRVKISCAFARSWALAVVPLLFHILELTNLSKAGHTGFCTFEVHVPFLSVPLMSLFQPNTSVHFAFLPLLKFQ